MYGMLWRALPGHWSVRVLILTAAAGGLLLALDAWVFPWALELLNRQDAVVES